MHSCFCRAPAHTWKALRTRMRFQIFGEALPPDHSGQNKELGSPSPNSDLPPQVSPHTHSPALRTKQSAVPPTLRQRETPNHLSLSSPVAPGPYSSAGRIRRSRLRPYLHIDLSIAKQVGRAATSAVSIPY